MNSSKKPCFCAAKKLIAAAAVLVATASSHGQQVSGGITMRTEDGKLETITRCGTKSPTLKEKERVRQSLQQWKQQRKSAAMTAVDAIIPVAFHVVRRNDGSGNVTDQQIQDQIEVLNGAYAGTGFQFCLYSIDRVKNSAWSNHTAGSFEGEDMKEALTVSPAKTLNFYICAAPKDNEGNGLLGYATFPWAYILPSEDFFMHGVVVRYSTLPGGSSDRFNEGDTGTHEIGHYLGLYHTFEFGCLWPGDEVDDTPYEAEATYGCPNGQDSCPNDPGLDPINNYMDYTDDACMDEFTPGQAVRMIECASFYRPTLFEQTNLTLTNQTLISPQVFEATNSIKAGPNLTILFPADVSFKIICENGSGIVLRPGFMAAYGSRFRAFYKDGVHGANQAKALAVAGVSAVANIETQNAAKDEANLKHTSAEEMDVLPQDFGLAQNYPNPFNPETAIRYQLPEAGQVTLRIYNVLGAEVVTLHDGRVEAGYHQAVWNGKDKSGRQVASGIYLYRLEVQSGNNGRFVATRKMNLLR